MTIAITAPTGNIGSRLAHLLLDAGADLTLLVRHPEKLDPGVRSRVNVQQGELQDETFVSARRQDDPFSMSLSPRSKGGRRY